mmetsp:Transcript_63392/g.141332  ORF Transcript_63392/g.141332 Transcript_63392/m.141332 type:complete len:110 (-) Transcript_63392:372-701(-)
MERTKERTALAACRSLTKQLDWTSSFGSRSDRDMDGLCRGGGFGWLTFTQHARATHPHTPLPSQPSARVASSLVTLNSQVTLRIISITHLEHHQHHLRFHSSLNQLPFP